ncbi:hypothetical protein jhhlp_005427 [Lomentospora prolificans]|uniref:Uncharacterized protein n=1 Tax=Lomentospora prolificans TaxID=41688 RepID=A0A2N3N6U3_9PEZI|nr:hypothetical protein jhhlp_005427 [Lomentospora prolificans]
MPKASEKAKAKLQEILNDPGRNDSSGKDLRESGVEVLTPSSHESYAGIKNKVIHGRHPSTGGCEITNRVDRRLSSSSQTSEGGRMKEFAKNLFSRPAY